MRRNGMIYFLLVLMALSACGTPVQHAAATAAPVSAVTAASAETSVPTPIPTAVPTLPPTPVPTPAPSPTPEPVTVERLDAGEFDGYFDDAVFIGDSLTKALGNYASSRRQEEPGFLGDARFMGVVNMNVRNASSNRAYENGVTFRYRGKAVTIVEGIHAYGAKKAFIMLGTNDFDSHPIENIVDYYGKLIELLQRECPDTQIILQGILPITQSYSKKIRVPIDAWNGINDTIGRICETYGVTFLRFGEQLMDEQGYLPLSLCSDQAYHLSREGQDIWVRALRLYAARQMCPDADVVLIGLDPQ